MTYEIIRQNFLRGLWTIRMVAVAVDKGVITPAQYQEITGESWVEKP